MHRFKLPVLAALALLVVGAGVINVATAAKVKPKTTRISVKPNGKEVPGAAADFPAVSANGRYVAYEAFGRLVPQDDQFDLDIYVRDLKTGRNELVSIKSNGKDGTNLEGERADISASGRFVSFSAGDALVPGDTNDRHDIYVHDRQTGKTKRVSVRTDGSQVTGIDADMFDSAISADGRFVAFISPYYTLAAKDTDDDADIYLRDRKLGTTKLVSLDDEGENVDSDANNVSISGNGRYVGFDSFGVMTDTPDTAFSNGFDPDAFVRDTKQKRTIRISLKSNGDEGASFDNALSTDPSISADGNKIAFVSYAPLVAADDNNNADIYIHTLKSGKTTLGSRKTNGDIVDTYPNAANFFPEISANGRYITWDTSGAFTAKPVDEPIFYRDIFRRDLKTGITMIISLKSNGDQVDHNHQIPSISGNGGVIAFSSMGSFNGAGDDGNDFDVFVRAPLPTG